MIRTTAKKSLRRLAAPLLAAALALGAAACDNPVQDDHDDHPIGVAVFSSSGAEVARYRHDTRASTGEIVVAAGAAQTFRIRLVAEDGDLMDVDGLEHNIGSPAVLISALASAELVGTDEVRITGKAAGEQPTTLQLDVLHGLHTEFTATFGLRITQ